MTTPHEKLPTLVSDGTLLDAERAAHEQTKAQLAKANGYWDGWMRDCTREQERREAAESALASARNLLGDAAATLDDVDLVNTAARIRHWLSSTPAPVAAPTPEPDASDYLDPCLAAPVLPAPVAAPCAGCAELSKERDEWEYAWLERGETIDALEQAIDAAVVELDTSALTEPILRQQRMNRALSTLRAARGAR